MCASFILIKLYMLAYFIFVYTSKNEIRELLFLNKSITGYLELVYDA